MTRSLHFLTIWLLMTSSLQGSSDVCDQINTLKGASMAEVSRDFLLQRLTLYHEVIEQCPPSAETYNNYGDLLEKLGRFKDALAAYQKAVELRPDVPSAYFGIGDIYYKTNKLSDATAWYEKGLALDPRDEVARSRLVIARNLHDKGHLESATVIDMFAATRAAQNSTLTLDECRLALDYTQGLVPKIAEPQLLAVGKALESFVTGKTYNDLERELTIEILVYCEVKSQDHDALEITSALASNLTSFFTAAFAIPRTRLRTVGKGQVDPVCFDSTPECTSLNRRIEIRLIYGAAQ